jgi:hypothetical protein
LSKEQADTQTNSLTAWHRAPLSSEPNISSSRQAIRHNLCTSTLFPTFCQINPLHPFHFFISHACLDTSLSLQPHLPSRLFHQFYLPSVFMLLFRLSYVLQTLSISFFFISSCYQYLEMSVVITDFSMFLPLFKV